MSGTGRLVGAVLLISGSCIGAGMLAMPVVTGLAGFVPALVSFVICWLFMTTTGLLFLEVNLWLGEQISIVSMSAQTMGRFGKAASWILFCFLFYLLLIAYIAASGLMVSDALDAAFGVQINPWVGSLLFTLFFGVLVYLGTRPVDLVNRVLMAGLILSYVLLVGLGVSHVRPSLLTHYAPIYAVTSLPVVVIAFGFHNMIPSMTRYLHANRKQLRLSVIFGSTLPLVIYLVWEYIILGMIPAFGDNSFASAISHGDLITQTLRGVTGATWVSAAAQFFAFFAIVTSFLAQALSLVHFLADGLKLELTRRWRVLLVALALAPPFVGAMLDPTIFVRAIGIAGAYSAVILFGIFPAIMAWEGRYREKAITHRLVPGGRSVLCVVIAFAVCVIVVQVFNQLGILVGA